MKLDRENYEPWALDYVEGNLPYRERIAFEAFLNENPDVAAAVRSLMDGGMPVLPVDRVEYPDKKALLRGGKSFTLRRMGSFLGGAAAASLLIGLFLLADRRASDGAGPLLSRHTPSVSDSAPAVPQRPEPAAAERALRSETTGSPAAVAAAVRPVPRAVPEVSREPAAGVRRTEVAVVDTPAVSGQWEPAAAGFDLKPVASPDGLQAGNIEIARMKPSVSAPETASFRAEGLLQGENAVEVRNTLASILAPLDCIIPIRRYRTEDESGVVIASLIRIGNRSIKEQ